MWVPDLATVLWSLIAVFAVLSGIGVVVLVREARAEGGEVPPPTEPITGYLYVGKPSGPDGQWQAGDDVMLVATAGPPIPAHPPLSWSISTAVLRPTMSMVTCPRCHGEQVIHHNAARNADGVWESDETPCTCDAGQVPAEDVFEVTSLPSGRVQYRCPDCWCNVDPLAHEPGSEDCRRAAQERADSISERFDG